jgi:hypothetical protein
MGVPADSAPLAVGQCVQKQVGQRVSGEIVRIEHRRSEFVVVVE